MADAIETQSTVFEIGITATPTGGGDAVTTLTVIKEVVSFTGLDGTSSEIDTTHLGSTAREYLIGLPDNGQFSLECNYLHADPGQDQLRALRASREVESFKITFSDAAIVTFDVYVLAGGISGGVDGKVDTSFTLRITGDVVGL